MFPSTFPLIFLYCRAGEKPEITSNAYLLLTLAEQGLLNSAVPFAF
ncbi:hypothetical protein G3A_02650 [Bacillus sp. 17376]|nr:hypothetical protein G3A_02650 [Bacillus sp. 17376]